MTTLRVGSPEYRKLARQHTIFSWRDRAGTITRDEVAELQRISGLMEQAELTHMGARPIKATVEDAQPGAIQAIAEDYDYLLRHCGDLGGVELY